MNSPKPFRGGDCCSQGNLVSDDLQDMKKIVATLLFATCCPAWSDVLVPSDGGPGSKPEPDSPFTIHIPLDGSGLVKIGEATLTQEQATEVLKAVRRADPESQLLIETQTDGNGRWRMALSQFAARGGYDHSTVWFRFIRAKKQGESEVEKETSDTPITRAESTGSNDEPDRDGAPAPLPSPAPPQHGSIAD